MYSLQWNVFFFFLILALFTEPQHLLKEKKGFFLNSFFFLRNAQSPTQFKSLTLFSENGG